MNKNYKVRKDALLLLIDIQDTLGNMAFNTETLYQQTGRLIEASKILGMDAIFTTQYAKGLGEFSKSLRDLLPEAPCYDKTYFSIMDDEKIREAVLETGKKQVIVVGIETHVCIMNSVIDLLEAGFEVFLVRDGVGSAHVEDHDNALALMSKMGAVVTTTQTVLFQLCEKAGTPEFKAVQNLIK